MTAAVRHPLAELFRASAHGCERHGRTNARLLADAADDLEAGGVTAAVMASHERDRAGSVPGLRFAAAVHRLVLSGRAPRLARHYATAGGVLDERRLWADARAAIAEHVDELRAVVSSTTVQTNEPGRSAPLFGGLLVAADLVGGLPIRLLEVGASAGLNLRPHRIRYELADGRVLGDPDSPLVIDPRWDGVPAAPLDRRLTFAGRAGCDLAPVDVHDPDGLLHLSSFVWPDQPARLTRLRAAVRLARLDPVVVQRDDGSSWLTRQLARPRPGELTVVWQSVVWQYVAASERARGQQVIAEAAARATDESPLALLVYESRREGSDRYRFELLLRLWPHGVTMCLGSGAGHGIPFTWSGDPSA